MWSLVSGVVKILSILEFQGGQRYQYSKCKPEVLPRGARAGRAFETLCPRAGARERKEWDLPGSEHPREVSGKVMSQTGGNPRAEGGQGEGNPSFPEPLMSRRFLEGPSVLPPPGRRYAALHPSAFGSSDSSRTRVTNFIPLSFPQAKSRRKRAREQTQTNK